LPVRNITSMSAMPRIMKTESLDRATEMTEPRASDEELMIAYVGGSFGAFDELFSRYKQPLFGFFRRRMADPAQAEELTQEAFLALFRSSSKYQPKALFRTYLYAIGLNILRAHRRKSAFHAVFFGAGEDVREPTSRNTFETDFVLRDALRKLDGTDREILLLREFEQLSYAEISQLLGLPINTVRSRLFRARLALRDLLAAPLRKIDCPELSKSEEER